MQSFRRQLNRPVSVEGEFFRQGFLRGVDLTIVVMAGAGDCPEGVLRCGRVAAGGPNVHLAYPLVRKDDALPTRPGSRP